MKKSCSNNVEELKKKKRSWINNTSINIIINYI